MLLFVKLCLCYSGVDGGERLIVIDGDACNQHDGRDVCHEHGQHMLQAEGNGFADRNSAVKPIDVADGRRCAGFVKNSFYLIAGAADAVAGGGTEKGKVPRAGRYSSFRIKYTR